MPEDQNDRQATNISEEKIQQCQPPFFTHPTCMVYACSQVKINVKKPLCLKKYSHVLPLTCVASYMWQLLAPVLCITYYWPPKSALPTYDHQPLLYVLSTFELCYLFLTIVLCFTYYGPLYCALFSSGLQTLHYSQLTSELCNIYY